MAKAKKGDDGKDGGKDQAAKDPGRKLRKLIKGARVVTLTTAAADGRLRSRPMLPGTLDSGALWFLTRVSSAKSADVGDNQKVNLAYSARKEDRYVSISGAAGIVRDAARVKSLWDRDHKAWFSGGKNDPELAVLRVSVEQVEYWDAKTGRMVTLAGPFEAPPARPAPPPAAKGPAPANPGALG
jgi:general stress protein 26